MNKWFYLSYFYDDLTPSYNNGDKFTCKEIKSIRKGDSCNSSHYSMPNHTGTHIDLPSHFDELGKTMEDYDADFWHFNKTGIIDLSMNDSSTISPDLFIEQRVDEDIDILLIKTGYSHKRNDAEYWKKSPVFLPQVADELRNRYKNIRMIGVDTISVSSLEDRKLGREVHKALLNNANPILIIEDMDLSKIERHTKINQLIVSPLLVKGSNGGPCTVMAEAKK